MALRMDAVGSVRGRAIVARWEARREECLRQLALFRNAIRWTRSGGPSINLHRAIRRLQREISTLDRRLAAHTPHAEA